MAPEVAPLEPRLLQAFVPNVTVSPTTLWPPNGRYVPVTVSGNFYEFAIINNKQVVEQLPGAKQASFQVVDEYHRDEPYGPIQLTNQGQGKFTFSFTVNLQASRVSQFPAGRRYYIIVGAKDVDGWWPAKVFAVQVPVSLQDRGPGPVLGHPRTPPAKTHATHPGQKSHAGTPTQSKGIGKLFGL